MNNIFNSFKRTNFKGYAKYYFNNTSQFKFFSPINSQKQISNLKNLFFAQNLLHLSNRNYLNNIMKSKIMLMLVSENHAALPDGEEKGIENLNDNFNSLLNIGILCERNLN